MSRGRRGAGAAGARSAPDRGYRRRADRPGPAESVRARRGRLGGDRGSSEVIGFVLVFALVFAGVGGVYAAGFDTLSEVRDRQQLASAERAFHASSGPLDDVQFEGVDRAVSLSPGTGRIQVDTGPRVVVETNGTARTITTGALTYRSGGSGLTHASGGVFRSDDGASVLLRDPGLACRPGANASVLSLVTYRSDRNGIDTDGHVVVDLRPTSTAVWRADRASVDVSPSAHSGAWGRYLDRTGWREALPGRHTCEADRTIVRVTTVHVSFTA